MTTEEVRNQLEELIKDRESFMVGDYDKDIYDRDKEALEFAVKAVEKQIPKKIKTVYLETICPYCGKIFYVGDPNTVMIYNFCPDCGQALDWSDEDE